MKESSRTCSIPDIFRSSLKKARGEERDGMMKTNINPLGLEY